MDENSCFSPNDEMIKPAIRFAGFTDAWEQRRLGEVVAISSGIMGDSLLSDGDYHLTRIETIADGIIDENKIGYTNQKPDDSYLLQKGDILYSNINSISHMGKVAIYQGKSRLYHGINLLRLTSDKEKIVPNFLFHQLATKPKRDWAKAHANQAVSQASINQTLLAKQEVSVCNLAEQEKIAEYFSNLDRLITLHQRKCDKLLNIKKSMLEKMFPKNGSDVPEIRFAGFTDAWEQRRLDEYLTVSSEKNTSGIYGKEDVLSVSGDYGIVNQITFQGRSFAGVSVSNYGVVHTGDIVYTKSPLNSNPYGIIKTNKGITGIVSTLYAVYHPKANTYADFVQTYFEQHARMNNYMHPLVNKGAKNDMKVSAGNALKGLVIFPKIDEQKRISEFFAVIDRLITLHQRKLEKLQNIKKSCLEKMFV